MSKVYLNFALIFLIIFLIRINTIGGLDPNSFKGETESNDPAIYLRKDLSDRINYLLPQPQAALLSGMLLGEKSTLPKSFNQALKNTSTIHIVVVSGQNLSLVAGFLLFFTPYLGRKKTLILTSGVVLGYCLLTGLQTPAIRAAIMIELAFLAQILGKEGNSEWILAVTAGLMLIFDPNLIFSISFQLSFLATAAVIIVSPKIVKALSFFPDIIKQDLGVSLAVQVLTWPVIAANFHQISLVGIAANTFILWTVSLIMISGALALSGSFLVLALGRLLAVLPNILLTYFVYIINFFNSLPFASIKFGEASGVFWAGYYLLVAGVFMLNLKNVQNDFRGGSKQGS